LKKGGERVEEVFNPSNLDSSNYITTI